MRVMCTRFILFFFKPYSEGCDKKNLFLKLELCSLKYKRWAEPYLLLSRCCPLQFFFGLRVFLLQLSFSLLLLVFLLQPLHLMVLQQPEGSVQTEDKTEKRVCLCVNREQGFCFQQVWVTDGGAVAPLCLLLAPFCLRSGRPQLFPHSVHHLSQSLVCIHQVTFRVGQFPQLDGLLLVLLLGQINKSCLFHRWCNEKLYKKRPTTMMRCNKAFPIYCIFVQL